MKDLLASSPHLAVIPALTALTIRHSKHKQRQDDGRAELEPKHPAVRFVLGAWIEGNFSDADKHIAPDIEIYTNGLSFSSEHDGPAMAKRHRVLACARRTCGWNFPGDLREAPDRDRVPDHRNPHRDTPSCRPAAGR